MNGTHPFTLYNPLVKPILVTKFATEINMPHFVFVLINDIEMNKLKVGHILIDLVPNYIFIHQSIDFLKFHR